MNVLDTFGGLSRQAGDVKVIEVSDLGVEDVERIQHNAHLVRDAITFRNVLVV
jgi:hypothetical protein